MDSTPRSHSAGRGARARAPRYADFLFTGVAVVPTVLVVTGHVDAALLTFSPLLFAACLLASYDESRSRRRD